MLTKAGDMEDYKYHLILILGISKRAPDYYPMSNHPKILRAGLHHCIVGNRHFFNALIFLF